MHPAHAETCRRVDWRLDKMGRQHTSKYLSTFIHTYGVDIPEFRFAVEDEVAQLVADLAHLWYMCVCVNDAYMYDMGRVTDDLRQLLLLLLFFFFSLGTVQTLSGQRRLAWSLGWQKVAAGVCCRYLVFYVPARPS